MYGDDSYKESYLHYDLYSFVVYVIILQSYHVKRKAKRRFTLSKFDQSTLILAIFF